jgi:hypothetical protein
MLTLYFDQRLIACGLHYTLRLRFLEMRTSDYGLTVSADFNLLFLTPLYSRPISFVRLPPGILKRAPAVGEELTHVRLREEDCGVQKGRVRGKP